MLKSFARGILLAGVVLTFVVPSGIAGVEGQAYAQATGQVKQSLAVNEGLRTGDSLVSPNKKATAVVQQDGNFVVYNTGGGVLFATDKPAPGPSVVVMQADGNLVQTSTAKGNVVWAHNTAGGGVGPAWVASLSDDGVISVKDSKTARVLWASPTHKSRLAVSEMLRTGEVLVSPSRKAFAVVQQDGNLVVYAGTTGVAGPVIWATDKPAPGPSVLVMQGDGNLVQSVGTAPGGRVIWAHNMPSGVTGTAFVASLSDEGALTVKDAQGNLHWASGPSTGDLVEEVPDMTQQEIQQVMDWIKYETTGERLPFCWRQTKTRGAGTVPGRVADCPPSYTNNGATCGRSADTIGAPSYVADCPAGYTNTGLTCYRSPSTYGIGEKGGCTTIFKSYPCKASYTDNGCFCGRSGHTLGASAMTCGAGYHKSDITQRCIKDCPAGYTNTGETCFRGVSTLGMGSMVCRADEELRGARCYPKGSNCKSDEEQDGLLCYPKCPASFSGEGPICWQKCNPGWASCAAGCGKTATDCGMTTATQVLSTLVLAANIATLGLSTPATGAASTATQTLTIGGKTVTSTTTTGRLLIAAVNKLQSVSPAGTKGAPIFRKLYQARLGTKVKTVMTNLKIAGTAFAATNEFAQAYASDFAAQTSPEINATINRTFSEKTAKFLKEMWGRQQLAEMASTNSWNIAQNVMSVVSLADISGVTGVVSAYAQPVCQEHKPMPCIPANVNSPNCK